jgi:WD40 repeat protein
MDGQIITWDVQTKEKIDQLSAHKECVLCLAVSPDGDTLATGTAGTEGCVRFWDLRVRKERPSLTGRGFPVSSLSYTPDGSMLAVADHKGVRTWDVGKAANRLIRDEKIEGAAVVRFLGDNTHLIVGTASGEIQYRDAKLGNVVYMANPHTEDVRALALNKDKSVLVSGGGDKAVRVWNAINFGEKTIYRGHAASVECIAYSPVEEVAALGGWDHRIQLWDVAHNRHMVTLCDPDSVVYALQFAPNGEILASAHLNGDVVLWDISQFSARKSDK